MFSFRAYPFTCQLPKNLLSKSSTSQYCNAGLWGKYFEVKDMIWKSITFKCNKIPFKTVAKTILDCLLEQMFNTPNTRLWALSEVWIWIAAVCFFFTLENPIGFRFLPPFFAGPWHYWELGCCIFEPLWFNETFLNISFFFTHTKP